MQLGRLLVAVYTGQHIIYGLIQFLAVHVFLDVHEHKL